MSDFDLTADLAADLDGTFESLVRAHQDGVFSVALRLTRHRHDAEEITQDTFVRAYRALGGYDAARIRELRVRPWLARIAVNLCRNRARTLRRRPPPGTLGEAEPAARDPGPDEQAAQWAAAGWWSDRLAELPPAQAAAVVLRHVWGLSTAEVAAAQGVPEGTVKARVHRGLAALRAALDRDTIQEVTR